MLCLRFPGLVARFLALPAIAALLCASLPAQQPLPTVLVAEARREAIADHIEALGTLRARESVEITATVGERVVEVGFSDGARVRKGDVLLRLSTDEVRAQLAEARATAAEARRQYERARQLASRGAAATAQLDEARREFETAQARVEVMESRLANLEITAPFDGVVGLRNISVGAVVRPGDLVTTLDDDSLMLLDFSVPEVFLQKLQPGATIRASTQAFPGEVFEGAIRSVDSRIDPITRSVTVRAELPNPGRKLRPGLLMTLTLSVNPRDAVLVPESALVPLGRENFLFVVEEAELGKPPVARRRNVTVGARRDGEAEVLTGLAAGERVVVHGAFRLTDGAGVRVLPSVEHQREIPVSQKEQASQGHPASQREQATN